LRAIKRSRRIDTSLTLVTRAIRTFILVETCSSGELEAALAVARVGHGATDENRLARAISATWLLGAFIVGDACSIVVLVEDVALAVRLARVVIVTSAKLATCLTRALAVVCAVSVQARRVGRTRAFVV